MHALPSSGVATAAIVTAAILFLCARTAIAQQLPARAFDIDGGSIQMHGGVLASKQSGLLGGARDELFLFLELKNEGKTTVWAEVDFQLPGADKALRQNKVIKSGDTEMYRVGVEQVAWDTKYPFKVSVYSDEERKRAIGEESANFFFHQKESPSFEKARESLKPNQATVVNGFRELTFASLSAEVTGTRAEPRLQKNITWTLFKAESKAHRDCEHQILKAEAYDTSTKSAITAKMGGDAERLEDKLRAKGDMLIEKWWVQSCEALSFYEVLLVKAPRGGTNIMVERLQGGPVQK